jgi:8-hydroxy-5-deazaflavin:NADPH oxidoreductase
VNATAGAASLEALRLAGEANLDGKVGDDPDAKALVTGLLTEGLGWRDVVDLGDITAARGAEMVMPLWLRPMGGLRTPMFNYKVVR